MQKFCNSLNWCCKDTFKKDRNSYEKYKECGEFEFKQQKKKLIYHYGVWMSERAEL